MKIKCYIVTLSVTGGARFCDITVDSNINIDFKPHIIINSFLAKLTLNTHELTVLVYQVPDPYVLMPKPCAARESIEC